MYNKEDLKFKLQFYSETDNAEMQGFVNILMKSIKERFKDDGVYKIPPLVAKSLEAIVAKNTTMVSGSLEVVETKYNVNKMCDDFDNYYSKLIDVLKFIDKNHKEIIDEIKEDKPKTFNKVSKIISRVVQSGVFEYPTYPARYDWEWFDDITKEVNRILNDKTLSEHKFDIEFVSTDTMSIAEASKFKVITVMYFKLTEYIPNKED